MKNCLGIEVGINRIKIVWVERDNLREFISERIEEGDLKDQKFCAETIRAILAEHSIRTKNAVFLLKQQDTYVKHFKLPLMTKEQLKLNLPYEFHDYTGERPDDYRYDYAVIDRTEDELELLAAACRKEKCLEIEKLAKAAKLKLVGIVPAAIGLERILERSDSEGERKDHAILDLRNGAVMVHFFRKGIYDITRTMEPGCEGIGKLMEKRPEKLREYGIKSDEADWTETDDRKYRESLTEECRTIAVQIMRVLNFYSFNHSDNTIDVLYYAGDGAEYEPLLRALKEALNLPLYPITDLIPQADESFMKKLLHSPAVYGMLLAGA